MEFSPFSPVSARLTACVTPSPIEGYLGGSQFWEIMNKAAKNIHMQFFVFSSVG